MQAHNTEATGIETTTQSAFVSRFAARPISDTRANQEKEFLKLAVPDAVLRDLRNRLSRVRYPIDFANDKWSYGTNRAYLEELVAYWRDQYDWRKHEAEINRFAHYRTEIEGVPIHFIHEPDKDPKPIPLILSHGWPWTFWDLQKVIRPLADSAAFGGDPADAFDVVVPSLPGFCFSTPLTKPGFGPDL